MLIYQTFGKNVTAETSMPPKTWRGKKRRRSILKPKKETNSINKN
jgi:hypothetical protein